jgi:hypothetical protein
MQIIVTREYDAAARLSQVKLHEPAPVRRQLRRSQTVKPGNDLKGFIGSQKVISPSSGVCVQCGARWLEYVQEKYEKDAANT